MQLSTIIRQLASGELKNVNLGSNTEVGITPYNYAEIVDHINLGLLDLYTKFPLKVREVFVQQYANIQFYHLNSAYAVTNTASTATPKYLVDTPSNVFDDTLLKIDQIYDESGVALSLDDDTNPESLYLTSMGTIQVPNPNPNNTMAVIYRASHPKLTYTDESDLDQQVELPLMLLQALLLFVASRVHGSSGQINGYKDAARYMNMYTAACLEASGQGVGIDTGYVNKKLEQNGWV